MKKILISFMVFSLIGSMAGFGIQVVKAVGTDLSLTMTGGVLSIDNSTATTAAFEGKTVGDSAQDTTANIGNSNHSDTTGIEVSDLRGTGAGWSATMTATNLTTRATVKTLAGSNNTVDFTGTFDGVPTISYPGTFVVEVTASGSVGVAEFKWTNPSGEETTDVTTAASVVLSNGISVTFGAATYAVGDKWSVGVDSLPYTSLTAAPSDIYTVSGSSTNVTAGSSGAMSGSGATSSAKTIMTASVNYGMGDYFIDIGLTQSIHAYPLSGSYSSTATLTVS